MAGKRAILDETFQFWTTREAADRTLSRIKEAGFNVYIPVVWYGAGTTWPSRLAPWDPALSAQAATGFDPLRYVIEKAHVLGIEVHPWFTVVLRRSDLFPEFALQGVLEGGNTSPDEDAAEATASVERGIASSNASTRRDRSPPESDRIFFSTSSPEN